MSALRMMRRAAGIAASRSTTSIHSVSPILSVVEHRTLSTLVASLESKGIDPCASVSTRSRTLYSLSLADSSTAMRWFSTKNETTDATTSDSADSTSSAETQTAVESSDGDDADEPVIEDQCSLSREEELQIEIKNIKDQLLRSLADQENTRRIANNDVKSAKQFAIKSFAKSLLEVADNLELALRAIPKDGDLNKNNSDVHRDHPVLVNLHEGVQLTEEGLLKAFTAHGLAKFGQVDDPFDPNLHDALMEYDDRSKIPGTVGQVMKSGFMLHGRVLRPAEVGVIKKQE